MTRCHARGVSCRQDDFDGSGFVKCQPQIWWRRNDTCGSKRTLLAMQTREARPTGKQATKRNTGSVNKPNTLHAAWHFLLPSVEAGDEGATERSVERKCHRARRAQTTRVNGAPDGHSQVGH
ncbi:Small ribosomal subunit protein [Trichinella spiralis]|uniref:Small ribosomal subunit protein n=1 Tax=Trichinella spiralis TaxID=6334 RepID=A0ABR3KJZ8_TRISP